MRAVAQVEGSVARTEVDGIPVFWADLPGPKQTALVFRVGRGDETLSTAGLTHLVEHLTLFGVGDETQRANGFVDHFRTVFYKSGSASEVESFVASVAGALVEFPLERLELEKQVLLTEAASASHTSWEWLMGLRFGAGGFGLVDYAELGLHRVHEHEVAAWVAERFVSANAAIWMTGEPPPTFGIELPVGRRSESPSAEALPHLPLPLYVPSGGGGVVLSFVGRRSTALTVAVGLLEQRVHRDLRLQQGLSYSASGTYVPLGGDVAHVTFGADCLDRQARVVRDRLIDELHQLAGDGPDPTELTRLVEERASAWSESESVQVAELDVAAANELLGAPQFTRAELIDEYEQLTPQDIADAIQELLPTAILSAPTGDAVPAGFHRYETVSQTPTAGRTYRRIEGLRGERSRISASEDAITYTPDAPAKPVTIAFSDVVAAVVLGPGRVELVARAGDYIRVDTGLLRDGARLMSDLERGIPSDLFIQLERQRQSVVDLSREKMGRITLVAREIEQLEGYLQAGERVLTLASAVRSLRHRGLLALTDRRLLYLAKAGSRKPKLIELPLSEVTEAKQGFFRKARGGILVKTQQGQFAFSDLTPRGRAAEFLQGLNSPDNPTITPQPSFRGGIIAQNRRPVGLIGAGILIIAAGHYLGIPLIFWGIRSFFRNHKRRQLDKAYNAG